MINLLRIYQLFCISFIILLFSCGQNQNNTDTILSPGNCKKIDFKKGVQLVDPLGRFTFNVPDSSWIFSSLKSIKEPDLFLLDQSDSNSYLLIVEIDMEDQNETDFINDLEILHEEGTVMQSGFISRNNKNIPWFLVNFGRTEEPVCHLFYYVTDLRNKRAFQISLASYTSVSDYEPLCELSGFIETFALK